MKKVDEVMVTITFTFDYTDFINGMIESEEIGYFEEINDFIYEDAIDDIQDCINDGIDKDKICIEIK